jgi:DNA-binding LacI/PurR family transcriptional regulator
MGRLATQRLLRTIEEELEEPPGYIELPTELVVRDSVCPLDDVVMRADEIQSNQERS